VTQATGPKSITKKKEKNKGNGGTKASRGYSNTNALHWGRMGRPNLTRAVAGKRGRGCKSDESELPAPVVKSVGV